MSGNALHSPVRWQNTNFAKTKCRVHLVKLYFHRNNLAAYCWPFPWGAESSSCGITCCHLPGCTRLRWLRSSHAAKIFCLCGWNLFLALNKGWWAEMTDPGWKWLLLWDTYLHLVSITPWEWELWLELMGKGKMKSPKGYFWVHVQLAGCSCAREGRYLMSALLVNK